MLRSSAVGRTFPCKGALVGLAIGVFLKLVARRSFLVPLALVASSVVLAGSVARADDDRELTAREEFAAGRYQEALDIYAKLFAETLHPTYLRNVGRCQQMLGNADQAIKTFREYLRRVPDLAPAQRTEVEGFIAEMEALKKTREKAAADQATTSPSASASAAQPSSAGASGSPSVEAQMAPQPEPGAEAGTSHRGQIGVVLRGDTGVFPDFGLVVAPGLSYGVSNGLEIEAGALVGQFKGGWAGARFFFSMGSLKPLASLGVPLFSAHGSLTPGIQPGLGLQWDADRHFGLLAEVTASYFPNASNGLGRLWLVPVLGVQGRL
jgi:tetratricopeptide (TPR) repeat protein